MHVTKLTTEKILIKKKQREQRKYKEKKEKKKIERGEKREQGVCCETEKRGKENDGNRNKWKWIGVLMLENDFFQYLFIFNVRNDQFTFIFNENIDRM